MNKPHIYDLEYNAFVSSLKAINGAQYASDVWRYLYQDGVYTFREMSSLPGELRCQLENQFLLSQPTSVEHVMSADGYTRKDLLVLSDEQRIEVVLLKYRERFSACVSTQVGCACGCAFCATGHMGFERQLSAGEIVAQVVYLQRVLAQNNQKLSNIVLMGMGEPLLNYDATLSAVRRFTDSRSFGIGPKRITLSSVGIPHAIRKLADESIPIKLAISLHAATDPMRNLLMPMNQHYPLDMLWEALRDYTSKTRRRVFLEWVLIQGINDTVQAAQELISWVRDLPVHVNLMQLNPLASFSGQPAEEEAVQAFTAILDNYQIPHTMRQRRGGTIQAGCGQLRSRHAEVIQVDSVSPTLENNHKVFGGDYAQSGERTKT